MSRPTRRKVRDCQVSEEVREACPSIPMGILRALVGRGFLSAEAIQDFLAPLYRGLHDPFLFADMPKVVERLALARQQNERILIHGDYDADGVTSAAIIATILGALGIAHEVFLPDRLQDGYGVSLPAMERSKADGTSILITTDCGISNAAVIAQARAWGVDTIIIDHHQPPDQLPEAYAIIHPIVDSGYPDKTLTGGGTAFKVLQALVQTPNPIIRAARDEYAAREPQGFSWEGFEKWILDLVAISTVADCTQLTGESRTLVYWGLEVLKKTRRVGLQLLLEGEKREITAQTIGFRVAPLINAAGRMEHARLAYELLMETDRGRAREKLTYLETLNTQRRAVTHVVVAQAMEQVGSSDGAAVVAYHPTWSLGVLGIVAARISDVLRRPAFVLTLANGRYVGSARAPDGYNLLPYFHDASHTLERFGGHEQAGGFTVKSEQDIEAFRQCVSNFSSSATVDDEAREVMIDAEIEFPEITNELLDWIGRCEPFGKGNPPLLFSTMDCVVVSSRAFKEGKHWELVVRRGRDQQRLVQFDGGVRAASVRPGTVVDVAYEIRTNTYNGQTGPNCYLVDVRDPKF